MERLSSEESEKAKPRVLVLYNLAEELKKGVQSDLLSEKEVEIIVPLAIELLMGRDTRWKNLLLHMIYGKH